MVGGSSGSLTVRTSAFRGNLATDSGVIAADLFAEHSAVEVHATGFALTEGTVSVHAMSKDGATRLENVAFAGIVGSAACLGSSRGAVVRNSASSAATATMPTPRTPPPSVAATTTPPASSPPRSEGATTRQPAPTPPCPVASSAPPAGSTTGPPGAWSRTSSPARVEKSQRHA